MEFCNRQIQLQDHLRIAQPFAIGEIGMMVLNALSTNGYISNLRICKGHAVYDGNFTVPTRELEVHLGAKGVVFLQQITERFS